jgi:carbonic anhydrase
MVKRRELLKVGFGFVGSASLAGVLGLNLTQPEPVLSQNNMTPDQAFNQLMAGNKRFIESKRKNPNQNTVRLKEVAQGQNPFAAVLSCADSRVPVEIIFDQGFGDVFVVRNAGNVGTPEEIGSLEFGTLVLGAKVLMVIGHEACGAVKATMEQAQVPGSIGSILDQIKPAIPNYIGQQKDSKMVKMAVEANVKFQVEKLKSSPVMSQLITENKLKIVGSYYELATGKITQV